MTHPNRDWNAAVTMVEGLPFVRPSLVLERGTTIRVVDLRDPSEATGPMGYIPGSVFVPEDRILALRPDDRPIVFVSAEGRAAAEVASRFHSQGVTGVAAMVGGLSAWRRAGFQTSRNPDGIATEFFREPDHSSSSTERRLLSIDDVRKHIGDPRAVRWIQLTSLMYQAYASCIDGRDARGIVGTPGGDTGELALSLGAIEQVTGKVLTEDEIYRVLQARIDMLGDVYLHTDAHALKALTETLAADPAFAAATASITDGGGWQAFLRSPDASLQGQLLEHVSNPAHIGCGHLKLMMTRPDEYGVRPELVAGLIRSFFRLLWAGATELQFTILEGGHAEGAVVNVRIDESLWPFSSVPVISPLYRGVQMFVNHPDVAAELRDVGAQFYWRSDTPARIEREQTDDVRKAISELGARQLAATVEQLAKGLPIYDVVFAKDGSFEVRAC